MLYDSALKLRFVVNGHTVELVISEVWTVREAGDRTAAIGMILQNPLVTLHKN